MKPETTPIEQAALSLSAKGWIVDWIRQPVSKRQDGFVSFRRPGEMVGVLMYLSSEEDDKIRAGLANIADRVAEAVKLAGPLTCIAVSLPILLRAIHKIAALLT